MKPLRVLLVDDDSPLLHTIAEYLRSTLKVIVYTASSVPAAISEIDTNGPFDVLVSDYQIPPHTAKDLASYLKHAQDTTPLILHSSFAGIDEKAFASESYLGLVSKPGNRELVRLIADKFPHAKK